jgi:hypothetical protein
MSLEGGWIWSVVFCLLFFKSMKIGGWPACRLVSAMVMEFCPGGYLYHKRQNMLNGHGGRKNR